MNSVEALVRPNIRTLSPYSTARDEAKGTPDVFLDANESPYPGLGYNRYPDPRQKVLKARVSALKGLPVENIFLGNGSDEAIDLMYRIFCTPGRDNALAIEPSYGMYTVAADINDVELRPVPLGTGFSLPVEEIFRKADDRTKLLFLCSLSAKGSLRAAVLEQPNLVVLQTFSKAYGMAGLRVGLAFAGAYIIDLMNRVKYPYNLSQATQELALKALETTPEANIREIVSERERLFEALPSFPFVRRVYPSDANFLLVQVDEADALYDVLLRGGIIVRNRSRVPGCSGCLRITVGTPAENDRLLQILCNYA